jgi:AcrR family transcriptional regulator
MGTGNDAVRRYHHGDLKAALIDGATELIAERGVRGFSLAELSRRAGVTVAAPYRHFAGREDLLAAVAVRALREFRTALAEQVSEADPPATRLAAMTRAYVRFAAEHRAEFSVVFGVGLDKKSRYPELRAAYEDVERMLEEPVAELCAADPEAAETLADAVEAVAHGYATLLTDGPSAPGPDEISRVAGQAANATLAVIQGRSALRW